MHNTAQYCSISQYLFPRPDSRNNVARWARVDRLRCHDEAFFAATEFGSVKEACSTREAEGSRRTGRGRTVWFRGRCKDSAANMDPRKREICIGKISDRERRLSCARVYIYACTYVHIHMRKRDGEKKWGRKKRGKAREFACAPARET